MNRELYQDIILSHFRNPKCKETLEGAPDVHVVTNPNCGDIVRLRAKLDSDSRLQFIQDAQGCAASVASTSILCDTLSGMEPEEAADCIRLFLEALESDTVVEPGWNPSVEIEALLFFRNVPARKLCVSLAWSCAQKALAAWVKEG